VIGQSGSVLVLLMALVAPAVAETPPPGPGPGRVFGYFDPGTGKFTMKENGANATRAETKPVKGTLTVHVDAEVSKPDPNGTIGCNVYYAIPDRESAYAPLQTADQATDKSFDFSVGYIFSGRTTGSVTVQCFAFTASGEQSGSATQVIFFNNPTEEILARVTLQ
jgi:hypothetical protein